MTSSIGPTAPAFFAELADHNNRDWWRAQGDRYDREVKQPCLELLGALEARWGPATVFRPTTDRRFAKVPYKGYLGAFVERLGPLGYYLFVDAEGVSLGAGYRDVTPAQLTRYRNHVAASGGAELADWVAGLQRRAFVLSGHGLTRVPPPYPPDHVRAELLRQRTFMLRRAYGQPVWLASSRAASEVSRAWRGLQPVVDWLAEHVIEPASGHGANRARDVAEASGASGAG